MIQRLVSLLIGLAVVVGLPVLRVVVQHRAADRCALDGATVGKAGRVDVLDADGHARAFCCLRCAEVWVRKQPTPPRSVHVTDEIEGTPIDADEAVFVRSPVPTVPASEERIHVFGRRADAEEHVSQYGGKVLSDDERPFRRRGESASAEAGRR